MTWERSDPAPANPLAWSVPFIGLAGIRLRVHFTFIADAWVVYVGCM